MQHLFSKLKLSFKSPTKIQDLVWKSKINNYIIQSPPGTGKTLAYAIHLKNNLQPSDFHPKALVVAPTTLLAEQIGHDMKLVDMDVQIIHGGLNYGQRKKRTNLNSEIVVSTPGYMNKYGKEFNLKPLQFCIFDEMDVLLDRKDEDNAISLLDRIGPQTYKWFVGATQTEAALAIIEENCPSLTNIFANVSTDQPQMLYLDSRTSSYDDMMKAVKSILSIPKNTLIFVNKKGTVKRLVREFAEFHPKVLNKPEEDYGISTIDALKALRYKIDPEPLLIISSQLIERGIDFVHLERIILFDAPYSMNSLIHRIGRLRFASKKQVIICVTDKNHELLKEFKLIKK